MQSGREVRVMVQPSEVDDLAAQVIAREIAKQIEDELTYPGPDPGHRGSRVAGHRGRALRQRQGLSRCSRRR